MLSLFRRLALAMLFVSPLSIAAERAALSLPLPWKPGLVLEYDSENIEASRQGDVARETRSTAITTVSIEQARTDGFLQRWSSRDGNVVFSGVPESEQRLLRQTAAAMGDLSLDIGLDATGAVTDIVNLQALLPPFRKAMQEAMQLGLDESLKAITDPVQRDKAATEANAKMAQLLDAMAGERVLRNLLIETPGAYNFFAGGGLELDADYEYAEQGDNPFGGDPFPMLARMRLSYDPDDAELLIAHWSSRLDPEKSAPILWAAVEKILQSPLPAEERKGLPKQIDIHTEIDYRIERATGIVHFLRMTVTRAIADRSKVKTVTLRLRR
jgi:hypothetical protein